MRKLTIWVSKQVDTNRPVQSQKIARSLTFPTKEEEGLYYPCSENKGADQLRGYREAGLRLCFRICNLFGFFYAAARIELPSKSGYKSCFNMGLQEIKMKISRVIGKYVYIS